MGPGRLTTISVILGALIAIAHCQNSIEDDTYKYVPKEDVEKFQRNLEIFGKEYGKNWMVIPNSDEVSYLALMNVNAKKRIEGEGFKQIRFEDTDMPSLVILKSYTKEFPEGKEMEPGNLDTLEFDPSKPTKMICHGWMANGNSSIVRNIKNAYLDHQNVNVIGVDWSELSTDYFYPNSVLATGPVGKYLASVIDLLVAEKKAKHSDFHLIGHSLGAHVFGFTGMNTAQKVGRITGLDPALPGFQYLSDDNHRLDPSDANFVDVIHTCSGILGMSNRAGHADFFPNGGTPFQPGCNLAYFPTVTQACSHGRSHQLFAESIRHNEFRAIGCSDWNHFKTHDCKNIITLMGEHASPTIRGPFYLKTQPSSPFALGLNGTFY